MEDPRILKKRSRLILRITQVAAAATGALLAIGGLLLLASSDNPADYQLGMVFGVLCLPSFILIGICGWLLGINIIVPSEEYSRALPLRWAFLFIVLNTLSYFVIGTLVGWLLSVVVRKLRKSFKL
jgi:hypothetical protein